MFKSKVSSKTLTKNLVENLFTNGNKWHGKRELLAEDLMEYNEIDVAAFQDQKQLLKIEIPSSILKIGNGAFIDCLRLKEVILPESIKSFGLAVFAGCFSLKKVNIPSNFAYIPTATFADCSLLENIELNNNIKKIGSRAFANCLSLKNIFIPESVEVIKENAFINCPSLSKGIFASHFYYQAHNFGLFEEQFNTLNTNLKSKISNEYLYERKLITRDEHNRIKEKINLVNFTPRPVEIIVPKALLKDKKEDNTITSLKVASSKSSESSRSLKPATSKKETKKTIPENQKHTLVPVEEYLEIKNYNYDKRKADWHKKAGHNNKQEICWGCKDDDNWESILLDNNQHVCYYCWIKKPVTKKEEKAPAKKTNALVVKKANNKKPTTKKQEPKPKKVNGIEVTKKHIVVKTSDIEKYNYDARRKLWHKNAGYSEKTINCIDCKENKHTSVLTDSNKHICYNCFIKKPKGNKKMAKPKN